MEALALPASEREEVRRLAEFLKRRRAFQEGQPLPPLPEGMRDWLLGIDSAVNTNDPHETTNDSQTP